MTKWPDSSTLRAVPLTSLPRPTARWQDSVRVVGAAVGFLSRALVRRLFGRSVNPKWPFRMELVVAATRGAWSVMRAIGMVRWRNVGEAMSPLRTDGLTPRFVNLNPGEEWQKTKPAFVGFRGSSREHLHRNAVQATLTARGSERSISSMSAKRRRCSSFMLRSASGESRNSKRPFKVRPQVRASLTVLLFAQFFTSKRTRTLVMMSFSKELVS